MVGGSAAGTFGLPVPGQEAGKFMVLHPARDDLLEDVLQISEGIETVKPGTLCRTPNYAEWRRTGRTRRSGRASGTMFRAPVTRHSLRRSESVKEGKKLVIRSETIARLVVVRREPGQRGFLQGEMSVQIDLGGVDGLVPQPQCDDGALR